MSLSSHAEVLLPEMRNDTNQAGSSVSLFEWKRTPDSTRRLAGTLLCAELWPHPDGPWGGPRGEGRLGAGGHFQEGRPPVPRTRPRCVPLRSACPLSL